MRIDRRPDGGMDFAEGQLACDELTHEAVAVAGELADAGAAPGRGDDGADDAALLRVQVLEGPPNGAGRS